MSFVAATDTFVRVFMTTMATEARRYGVYIVASNTQAPFRLTRNPGRGRRAARPGHPRVHARLRADRRRARMTRPSSGVPAVVHRRAPAPLANLIAVNRKVPLTTFETDARVRRPARRAAAAAIANLRPVGDPGHRRPAGLRHEPARVRLRPGVRAAPSATT